MVKGIDEKAKYFKAFSMRTQFCMGMWLEITSGDRVNM